MKPDAIAGMVGVEDIHWWHVAKRALVSDLLPRHSLRRILDVGCGGGALMQLLSSRAIVYGLDSSPISLRSAKDRGFTTLSAADATALPFSDDVFDAVMALDVIEHLESPHAVLREMRRVLHPDGTVIVTVPAYTWMWSYADQLLGHYRRYTRKRLVRELIEAGFTIGRATYFHSWLLPIAWVFRRVKGALGKVGSTDDFPLRPLPNRLLLGVTRAELRLLLKMNLPFGLSIAATARRS